MASIATSFQNLNQINTAFSILNSGFSLASAISWAQSAFSHAENVTPYGYSYASDSQISVMYSSGDSATLYGSGLSGSSQYLTRLDYHFSTGLDVTLLGSINRSSSGYMTGYISKATVSQPGLGSIAIYGNSNVHGSTVAVSKVVWDVNGVHFEQGGSVTASVWISGGYYQVGLSGLISSGALTYGGQSLDIAGISVDARTTASSGEALLKSLLTVSDTITASGTSTTLFGYGGNDTLIGGEGTDTALFSGPRTNYTITKTTTGYTVADNIGTDGTDTLSNVEQAQFTDHTTSLAQMDRVFKYFIAYYGRAPSSTGAYYWLDNLSGTFAGDERQLVWNFGSSTQTEFMSLYGSGGSISDFVSKVYDNIFNRTPLQSGLDYWNGVYNTYKAQGMDDNTIRGMMVTWIMDGAANTASNKDLTTFNNKVVAASAFTAAVNTPDELAGYRNASNTAALDYARSWLHEITSDAGTLSSHVDHTALDQTTVQLVGLYSH